MAFISGARQCGKTTLAKLLGQKSGNFSYFNWDEIEFRKKWKLFPQKILEDLNFNNKPLIILDELRKAKYWKRDLKGLYDSLVDPVDIIVTGSARLNIFNKGSDSLFGRYYHYRLHPFSLAEINLRDYPSPENCINNIFENSFANNENSELFDNLLKFGGFPEPFLSQSDRKLRLWQRTREERVVREDLRDISRIPELGQIEMLIAILSDRVSVPLKKQKLVNIMEVSHGTIKRWLEYLKELYFLYEVKPYYTDIKSSLRKEGKLFLCDYSTISDESLRFENLIANHLLKACHFWTDAGYGDFELSYLRNKREQEIDFLILKDNKPWLPVEVKSNDTKISPNWKTFLSQIKTKRGLQIIKKHNFRRREKNEFGEILIVSASDVLSALI